MHNHSLFIDRWRLLSRRSPSACGVAGWPQGAPEGTPRAPPNASWGALSSAQHFLKQKRPRRGAPSSAQHFLELRPTASTVALSREGALDELACPAERLGNTGHIRAAGRRLELEQPAPLARLDLVDRLFASDTSEVGGAVHGKVGVSKLDHPSTPAKASLTGANEGSTRPVAPHPG